MLGASDENNVLENENDGEILKETSATMYVDANAAASGDGKSEATAFQNLKNALFLRGFIYSCCLQFVYFYWINFFLIQCRISSTCFIIKLIIDLTSSFLK